MIGDNHEKGLISLAETLKDTTESQWVVKWINIDSAEPWALRMGYILSANWMISEINLRTIDHISTGLK